MKDNSYTPDTVEEQLGEPNNAPLPQAQNKPILEGLLDVLKGVEMDYTKGSINMAILLLSVPMIIEMFAESLFAVVDIYFVGKLGASAVSTVGLTESVLSLMYAFAIGLSMGATALVARRIGEKEKKKAADSAVQAIMVAIATSIPFAIAGIFYSKQILGLMGAEAKAIEEGYRYTQWMLGGNVVIMLLFVINGIFRGAGDALIAMFVLFISNGINIILDPMLIFGWGPFPAMGLEGAAIATNIGRGTGVLFQLYILFKGTNQIKVLYSQMRLNLKVMWQMIVTSIGGIGQFIIATASWVILMRIMSVFGSETLAGYTIAIRIFIFTLLPSWGLSNAAATLVGQNLGANQPDRAERSVWITGFVNTAFLGTVSILYIIFNKDLVMIFSDEPTVIAYGSQALYMFSFGYIVMAWGLVMPQAFNGAGDTFTPTLINLVCYWMLQIPLAYLLAIHIGIEQQGVYFSILGAETLAAAISIYLFRKGKWKTIKV